VKNGGFHEDGQIDVW